MKNRFLVFIFPILFVFVGTSCDQFGGGEDSADSLNISGIVPSNNYKDNISSILPQTVTDSGKSSTWDGFREGQYFKFDNSCLNDRWENCLNSLKTADLDLDGDIDIMVTSDMHHNQSAKLVLASHNFILMNNGDGTFADPVGIGKNGENDITHLADMNGDGYIDLLGRDFWGNRSFVQLGTSNPFSFSNPYSIPTGTHGGEAFVIDYDGDGRRDVISGSSGSAVQFVLHLFKNTGTGFQHHVLGAEEDASYHSLFKSVGDINSDGYSDFLLEGMQDQLFLMVSQNALNYTSTFVRSIRSVTSESNILQNYPLFVFENSASNFVLSFCGDNEYVEKYVDADAKMSNKTLIFLDVTYFYSACLPADFNGDGLVDLVVPDWNFPSKPDAGKYDLYFYERISETAFEKKVKIGDSIPDYFLGGDSTSAIVAADFNGDGFDDVATIADYQFDVGPSPRYNSVKIILSKTK